MKVRKVTVLAPKKRTAAEIAIWTAGFNLKAFADAYGCTDSFVTLVVKGFRRSAGLEKLIADTLKTPVESLFPPHNGRGRPPHRREKDAA